MWVSLLSFSIEIKCFWLYYVFWRISVLNKVRLDNEARKPPAVLEAAEGGRAETVLRRAEGGRGRAAPSSESPASCCRLASTAECALRWLAAASDGRSLAVLLETAALLAVCDDGFDESFPAAGVDFLPDTTLSTTGSLLGPAFEAGSTCSPDLSRFFTVGDAASDGGNCLLSEWLFAIFGGSLTAELVATGSWATSVVLLDPGFVVVLVSFFEEIFGAASFEDSFELLRFSLDKYISLFISKSDIFIDAIVDLWTHRWFLLHQLFLLVFLVRISGRPCHLFLAFLQNSAISRGRLFSLGLACFCSSSWCGFCQEL